MSKNPCLKPQGLECSYLVLLYPDGHMIYKGTYMYKKSSLKPQGLVSWHVASSSGQASS